MLKFICNRLSNTKLPLDACRGSETRRFAMANKMTKKMFKQLPDEYCTAEQLRKTVNNILEPNNINFTISDNTSKISAGNMGLGINVLKANPAQVTINVERYDIKLTKQINGLYDTFTAVHEFGHMFDKIHNPKGLTIRSAKLAFDTQTATVTDTLRMMFLSLPIPAKTFGNSVKYILNSIPDEHAVDTLQSIRFSLKTEINQYKLGMQNLIKKGKMVDFVDEFVIFKKLGFEKKLELVNKLLKERLAIARENLAKKKR